MSPVWDTNKFRTPADVTLNDCSQAELRANLGCHEISVVVTTVIGTMSPSGAIENRPELPLEFVKTEALRPILASPTAVLTD